MKRREFLIGAPLLVAGCASWMKPNGENNGEIDPGLLNILVNTAGVAVGFAVVGMAPEVDSTLRSLYNVAKEGKFDLTPLNDLIAEMLKNEDLVTRLVANRLLKIAELFGGMEVAEPHFCNPYEPEIALLVEAMALVERARELTIKAITNDVEEEA